MRASHRHIAFSILAVVLLAMTPAVGQVDRSLEGDQKCTTCHNETWQKPILTIYQTKHGVKGDPRTPGCQSCNGESAQHQQDPTKTPDVVFGAKSKNASPVEAKNAACLTCHETKVRPRAYWSGSQHDTHGVACTDCHEAHNPNQKVLSKITQPEVCFIAIQPSAPRSIVFPGTQSSKAK